MATSNKGLINKAAVKRVVLSLCTEAGMDVKQVDSSLLEEIERYAYEYLTLAVARMRQYGRHKKRVHGPDYRYGR